MLDPQGFWYSTAHCREKRCLLDACVTFQWFPKQMLILSNPIFQPSNHRTELQGKAGL